MAAFDTIWAVVVFLGVRALAARLLAVRIGFTTSVLTAVLAIAAGVGLQRAVASGRSSGLTPYVAFAVLTLLVTMVVVTIAGLLTGPAVDPRRAMSRTPHPLRRLRMRLARMQRYLSLLWLGARYGLGPLSGLRRWHSQQDMGVALRDALQEAGGIFIKFGQLLSARSDLVPAAIAIELSSLQDDVKPLPSATVLDIVAAELDRPVSDVFKYFDEAPLAAASIAQVHRAELATGEQVVVKVQRPGIDQLVERDVDILLRLSHALETRADWARRLGSAALAEAFARNLAEELDFRIEARNIAAVAACGGTIQVPRVHRHLTTRRVLVEDWIDGVNLRNAGNILDSTDRSTLARSLLDGLLDQVFKFGIFHADPHAGNVLLTPAGGLVMLDFGSVGRLDRAQQIALAQVLAAIAWGRPALLCDALLELAASSSPVDADGLERALARFLSQTLAAGAEPGINVLNDMLDIIMRFGLTLDPQLAGVFRALATLDGTVRLIDPAFNVIDEGRRYANTTHLGIPRPKDLRQDALDDLIEILPAARRLPRRLDRITVALERGEFAIRIRPLADARDVAVIGRLTNRFLLAFFSASIGLVSVLLLAVGSGPRILDTRLDVLLGYLGLICATILGLRVIAAVTRDGD
jgi:ubiquinone biosynthesis protein